MRIIPVVAATLLDTVFCFPILDSVDVASAQWLGGSQRNSKNSYSPNRVGK